MFLNKKIMFYCLFFPEIWFFFQMPIYNHKAAIFMALATGGTYGMVLIITSGFPFFLIHYFYFFSFFF
jgi:hypothetical protein